jgi:hypothetical protein
LSGQEDLIVSIHIPKTAGRSFRQTLGEIAPGHIQGDYGNQPSAAPTPWRQLRERFMAPKVKPGTRIVHGHFVAAKYWRHYPEATYIAWVRDPVERLASHYYFWQRGPRMQNPACRKMIEEKLSLQEFAALPEMRNVQAGFLKGVPLSALAFIGITEQYDRSIALFRQMLFPQPDALPTDRCRADSSQRQPGARQLRLELRDGARRARDHPATEPGGSGAVRRSREPLRRAVSAV